MPHILENQLFKLVAWAIPATILIIFPSFSDPINLPKLLVLIAITTTTIVMYFALRSYSAKKAYTGQLKLVVGTYALLALTMLISGFTGNDNLIRALFGADGRNNGLIYYTCVFVIVAVVLVSPVGKPEINYLERTLTWTSLVLTTYCFMQFLNWDPVDWANPYNRVIGTLGNPNFAASALACFAIFWLYRFFRSKEKKLGKRVLFLIPTFFMAYLSWATGSIQGLIVIALGSILIFYMHVRERSNSKFLPYGFFVVASLTLFFLFASFLGFGPLGDVMEQYTLKLRGWYAYFGLLGMLKNPWTGIGVDSYIDAFRMYKTESFVAAYGSALSSNNAHSVPIQIGASFGIIVFVLYCFIQCMIFYKALKIINSRDVNQFYFKGIALIWLLLFAQSLLSIELIGLGVINWILGALILSSTFDEELSSSNVSKKSKFKIKTTVQFPPLWTGVLTFSAFLLGSVPTIVIAQNDLAYKKVAFGRVIDDTSRQMIQREYGKLNALTFAYPERISLLLSNLQELGLQSEIEMRLMSLFKMEKNNALAADLLATYYGNTGQIKSEVEVRVALRELDPWNEKLELALAISYSRLENYEELRKSVQRLGLISPESPEYTRGLELLRESHQVP